MPTTTRYAASQPARRAARGFTLIETMIATAIVAVLSSAAVPSMFSLVTRHTADSQIVDFNSALRFARAEAMKRGETVTLCARAEGGDDAAPACREQGGDWSNGWLVFVDREERGQFDDADRLLRIHQRPASAGRVTASGSQHAITFQLNGVSSKANTTVRFSPAGASDGDLHAAGTQVICINKPGKARVVDGSAC